MGHLAKKIRGAAAWCQANGVEPGDTIETSRWGTPWAPVRVTGIGESAILMRRKGAAELAHGEPSQLRVPRAVEGE